MKSLVSTIALVFFLMTAAETLAVASPLPSPSTMAETAAASPTPAAGILAAAEIGTHSGSSQPLSSQSLSGATSITAYGAKCDWNGASGTDDTEAIQNAIDTLEKRNRSGTLFLPAGSLCRITAPILLNSGFVSIYGEGPGSGFVADYSDWHGSSYNALELSTTIQHILPGQTLSDFSINGYHNSKIASTGLKINDPLNEAPHATYVVGLNIRNLVVKQFDTAFTISDAINSLFSFLQAYYVRQGFLILGQDVNDSFNNLIYFSPSHSFTASTAPFIGFEIDQKSYAAGKFGPEGINLDHSVFLAADNDLVVGQVLQMNVDHNVFDLAHGNAVVLNNPNEIKLAYNYIAIERPSTAAIYVAPGINIDGSSISNNTLMGYGLSGQTGIFLAPGGTHRGMHIDENRFHGFDTPIDLGTVPIFSTIQDNYGVGNSKARAFIRLGPTGACGRGTVVRGNNDADAIPMIEGNCAGFTKADNRSTAPVANSNHN